MASDPAATRRSRLRTRGQRVSLAVWAGLATFVVLLILDGLWAGSRLLSSLTRSRSELSVAIESVVTGDAEAARPHLAAAEEAADDALGAVGHPSFGLAGLLPIVGDNIDAAAAVAEASRATSAAGTKMLEVARDLGWTDIDLPGTAAAGQLDIPAFASATPGMGDVVAELRTAREALEAAGGGRLIGPVATGYRDALEGLTRRADLAARFGDAIRLVQVMFGGGGSSRYLICVPALGVARSGGGAPAAVGVMTALNGSLTMEPLAPAPAPLAQVSTSPDWPRTARALIAAARPIGIRGLDGVILLDPTALQDLVWVTGDVQVESRHLALSDRTTVAALEIEAFLGLQPGKTARRHAAWASDIVYAFLSTRPALESFALASSADARDRHLAVFSTHPDARRLVRALGLDGRARVGGTGVLPVMATWATEGGSHVGALVDTTIRYDVGVRTDGSASVEAEVLFENRAGTDPPSVLLGRPASGIPVGTFAANVTLYIPAAARNVVAETSTPSPIEIGEDLHLATVTGSIAVRGHESTTLTCAYVMDHLVQRVGGVSLIMMRLLPQPTIGGIRYEVRLRLPDGSTIVSSSRGLEPRGSTATLSGVRGGPADLEVRYV